MGSFVFAEYDNSSNQILDPNELSYSKPYILAQSAVPVMIAQSGFVGAGAADNGCIVPGPKGTDTTVTLSASSGAGVTVTFGIPILTGTAADVGKQITIFDSANNVWRSILVTASGSTTSCVGTLFSTFSATSLATSSICVGNPLPTTYSGGIWAYLPAGAMLGGSAGFYWCLPAFTGTANGILRATTAYQATMGVPKIPTGFSNTVGSGGNSVGSTSTQTLASVVVPGGAMGSNGKLRYEEILSIPNTAGNKTLINNFGGQGVFGAGVAANLKARFLETLQNRGVSTLQLAFNNSSSFAATSNGGVTSTTVNTALDQSFAFTGQVSTATDFLVLEGFTVELLASP